MATATNNTTTLHKDERILTKYKQRGIKGIITWWKQVSAVKIGQNLVINSLEEFDEIYYNGKCIFKTNGNT